MTDKELKKLSRAELLELLIAQVKENSRLRNQLDELKEQLEERSIVVTEAGSMAEAALRLNGVFKAADMAAQHYLSNCIKQTNERCKRMEDEAWAKCAEILRQHTAMQEGSTAPEGSSGQTEPSGGDTP